MTNDLIEHIRKVLKDRPTDADLEPRRYKRRETWVPVVGDKVTVWRMSSYDPDRQIEYPGIFLDQDDTDFTVQVDDHETPQKFSKRDKYGVVRWRLDSRGHRTLPPHI